MPGTNQVKISIGKESTPGTPVAPTAVLPIRAIGSLDRTLEMQTDPVICGAGMAADEFPVAADVKGSIPLSPRACAGFGQVLKGTFGLEDVSEIVGVVRVKYTGSAASCKITADNAAKTLNAKVGALGSEANDSTFGTSGTLSLTNAANDTLAELVAVIDGLADYEAKLVTGAPGATIASVMAATSQAKGKWAVIVLTGSASGAYAHRFTPDLAAGSERPTFSIQKDGFQDNYKYAGNAVGSLSLSAALKAALDADLELVGFTEAAGQTAMSALKLPDAALFIFGSGLTSIGGKDYDFVRNVSAKFENNPRTDGYAQSSLDRAFHQKGLFAASGDMKLRLDATSILERPKVEAGTPAPILLLFQAGRGKKIGTSGVAEMLIVEIPYAKISTFSAEENSGALDAALSWKGFAPGGTTYDPPVVVTMLSADNAAY